MSEENTDVTMMDAPIYLKYKFTAGEATARFLTQLAKGRLVGQECPSCKAVLVPPRGSCARCGVGTEKEVTLADTATVQSFTIVYIPIPGNPIKPPYIIANLVPDGANISFIHLISECNNDDVKMGMRVEAVWKPESEWDYAMDNISYFKPLDNEEGVENA
ncbi:MAG: Zn-ribbon domain-containing OB-fold protein [Pseudomonadales bacterium]